jgi:hypothetical protein
VVIFAKDAYYAHRVVKSDIISDGYTDVEATRWLVIRSYGSFCMATRVRTGMPLMDRLSIWLFVEIKACASVLLGALQFALATYYLVHANYLCTIYQSTSWGTPYTYYPGATSQADAIGTHTHNS